MSNKLMTRTLSILIGSLACVAIVAAQVGEQSAGGRRQGGGNSGPNSGTSKTNRMQFLMPRMKSEIMFMNDVMTELGIDRTTASNALQARMKVAREDWTKSGDPEGTYKRWLLNTEDVMLKVINKEQRGRLDELFVQYNGYFALTTFDVAKAVALTPAQKEAIEKLVRDGNKLLMKQYRTKADGTFAGTDLEPNKMIKEIAAKIKPMLTPEQDKALQSLRGEEYKFAVPSPILPD